jgi:hypothetical protein
MWKAKELGFDVGAAAMAAGVLLTCLVGSYLGVLTGIAADITPWKLAVSAAMMMLPYKLAQRFWVGKKPT